MGKTSAGLRLGQSADDSELIIEQAHWLCVVITVSKVTPSPCHSKPRGLAVVCVEPPIRLEFSGNCVHVSIVSKVDTLEPEMELQSPLPAENY